MAHYTLDARNLMCPLPVIRAQDRIKTLLAGDELTVYSTDPGALNDIPAWCRINGHTVVSMSDHEHEVEVTILVNSAATTPPDS